MQTWEGEYVALIGLMGCYVVAVYVLLGFFNYALPKPMTLRKRMGFAVAAGLLGTLTSMFPELRVAVMLFVFIGSFWWIKNLPGREILGENHGNRKGKRKRPISSTISAR